MAESTDGISLRARILVVDDEDYLAEFLADLFSERGYQVDTAGDVVTALGSIAVSTPDVIVSDFKMPGMDGRAFYETLERQWPALCRRFVLLAGNTESAEVVRFTARTGVPVIAKPFDIPSALDIVRGIAAERAE